MEKVSKYLIVQNRNVNTEFSADTEKESIEIASRRILCDTEKRYVVIYKAIKIVRPKESPVVVDDIPE